MNRKGLASGIIAVIIILFFFAMVSLLSISMWNYFDNEIQGLDNNTVSPSVKQNISDLGFLFGWGDTIFVLFFLALLIGYMVTSLTISTDKTIYIFLFFVFLVFSSIVAMIVSNGWTYLTNFEFLNSAAQTLTFTNWFMTYLPVVTFFMGLIGAIIFYGRKKSNPTGDSFNVDFESNDGSGEL